MPSQRDADHESDPVVKNSFESKSPDPTADELLLECEALIRYVSRHGNLLEHRKKFKTDFGELVDVVAVAGKSTKVSDSLDADIQASLQKAYAKVTGHTQTVVGVSGRSILDTWETEGHRAGKTGSGRLSRLLPCTWRGHKRPLAIGVLLFLAALLIQAVMAHVGRIHDPLDLGRVQSFLFWSVKDLFPIILASVWGGVGSCIFLMKKLSDRLSEMTYEKSRQKGDLARITVGAFLGVAVVELFFTDFSDNLMIGEVDFGPNLAALLAGLAVKPVYGAFETLAESLAERISGKPDTPDR